MLSLVICQDHVKIRYDSVLVVPKKTSQMVAVCVIPALIGDARLLVEATLDLEDLR